MKSLLARHVVLVWRASEQRHPPQWSSVERWTVQRFTKAGYPSVSETGATTHRETARIFVMWPSGLARWLVDSERTVVGSNPNRTVTTVIAKPFRAPLAKVLKSRLPQSVPTMPTSLRWNHLSNQMLCNGASPEVFRKNASSPKGLLTKT